MTGRFLLLLAAALTLALPAAAFAQASDEAIAVPVLRANVAVESEVAWLPFWLAVGLFAWACWRGLDVRIDRFVVTNMRVFRVRGVLVRSIATMPLTRILDWGEQRRLWQALQGQEPSGPPTEGSGESLERAASC